MLAKNVIFSSGAMFVTVLLRDGVSSEYNYKTCQSVLLIQEIGNIYSIYKLQIRGEEIFIRRMPIGRCSI